MDFQAAFTTVAHSTYALAIIILIAVDFATGVLSALRQGKFTWKRIGDVIPKSVLGALATLGAQVVGHIVAGTTGDLVDPLVFGVFALASIASSLENVQEITGLPLAKFADQVTNSLLGWLRKNPTVPPAKPPPPPGAPPVAPA